MDPAWILRNGADLQAALFVAALGVFAGLERLAPRRHGSLERRRRWPTNLTLTLLNVAALSAVPISFVAAAAWAESAGVGLLNALAAPSWAAAAATLLARAFLSTGTHWLNHKLPWLWRIHRVHHLDSELDVSSTVRFHPLEVLVGPLIGVPAVVLFGLSPWVLAAYELLDVAVTLFSHANLRGAVFPLWDLLLGTFRAAPREPHETMPLGLSELRGPEAQRLGLLLLAPFRRTPGRAPARPLAESPAR